MDKDPYNKRETDILLKGVDDKLSDLLKHLDKQDRTLERIEVSQNDYQARLSKLEDVLSDYAMYKKTVDGLVNYRWWLVGAGAAFIILGGSMFLLVKSQLTNDIQTKISIGIDQAFNNRFSKVQVINNN